MLSIYSLFGSPWDFIRVALQMQKFTSADADHLLKVGNVPFTHCGHGRIQHPTITRLKALSKSVSSVFRFQMAHEGKAFGTAMHTVASSEPGLRKLSSVRFFACRDDTIRHLEARGAAVTESLTDAKASHSSLLEQLEVRDPSEPPCA